MVNIILTTRKIFQNEEKWECNFLQTICCCYEIIFYHVYNIYYTLYCMIGILTI